MVLGGIWHGAAWKFVLWGTLHGGGLAIERALGLAGRHAPRSRAGKIIATLIVFHFVCLAWIFFRAESMPSALALLEGLGRWNAPVRLVTPFLLGLLVLGMAINFTPRNLLQRLEALYARWPWALQGIGAGLVVVLIETLGGEGVAPFIYFQF